MLRLSSKILLFICAYSPLYVILILQNYEEIEGVCFWISLIFIIIFIIFSIFIISSSGNLGSYPKKLIDYKNVTGESLGYIFGYVIALANLELSRIEDLFILGIFSVILFSIYTNSGMLFVNPVLNVLGFKIYKVVFEDKDEIFVLTRKRLRKNQTIMISELGDEFFYVKKNGESSEHF